MPETTDPTAIDPDLIPAVHLLAMNRTARPDLKIAEAKARLELAAAIMEMDIADHRIADGEPIHSLGEQAAVELATHAYAQALANLVRCEADS